MHHERWLGPLNVYLLRWLFLRLSVTVDEHDPEEMPESWELMVGVWPGSGYDGKPFEWVREKWIIELEW
jgi:hypothetical protein